MLFYRSTASVSGRGPSLAAVRTLCAVALAAYPAGTLTLALGGNGEGGLHAFEIVGLALVLVALVAAAPVLGSHLQRIVGEQPSKLDEFELSLRNRATSGAYAIFTGLTLVAVVYAAIAADAGLWIPASYEEFNALFWGIFLYSALLPTAVLAWHLRSGDDC